MRWARNETHQNLARVHLGGSRSSTRPESCHWLHSPSPQIAIRCVMNTKAGSIAIALALFIPAFALAAPEIVTVENFKNDLPKVAQKVFDIVQREKQHS